MMLILRRSRRILQANARLFYKRPHAEDLAERTELVRAADQKGFRVFWRRGCERPHMLYNNVTLYVGQKKTFLRVLQSCFRVSKPVQTLSIAFQMPVVQKKIVQKSSAD